MMLFVWIFSAFLTLLPCVCGYQSLQKLIPNGHLVPNPCTEGSLWGGVGHLVPDGTGRLNAFGEHFDQHGKKWTKELCQLDSDIDGRTNGEELGDPDCVWRPGRIPARSVNISHPGICEPLNRPKCQSYNSWVKCKEKKLVCDILNETDTKNITLRFPNTKLPNTETNYYCMLFDLPQDADYHMVATQPVIINKQVVHHILVFGCDPEVTDFKVPSGPYPCGMLAHSRCTQIIGTWTIGSPGECLHDNVGFRLGLHGYRKGALQIHWNNPDLRDDFEDSSGLRLYYSPNLRVYDAGLLVVGEHYLEIAPQPTSHSALQYVSTCPSRCTRQMFQSTIYITTAINHMHYLGISQRIELFRNGTKVRDLTYDRFYEYDNPIIHTFDPPIEFHRGDELRTTCNFKRPPGGNPVCFGEATSDEMCYGFITYYPMHELHKPWCTTRKSIKSCDRHYPHLKDKPIDNCYYKDFLNPTNRETAAMFKRVIDNCVTCDVNCAMTLKETMKHPCLTGDIGSYVMQKLMYSHYGLQVVNTMLTCDCDNIVDFGYCERKLPEILLGQNAPKACAMRYANGSERSQQGPFHIISILFFFILSVW